MKTKRLVTLSLITTAALALSVLESMLPPIVPLPGVRLGLANIATLLVLYLYKPRDAAMVLAARIVLAALFSGRMTSLFYSAAGGLCCFIIMALFRRILPESRIWVTSVFGAMVHNGAQLIVAALLLGSAAPFTYAPALIISAIVTGTLTGITAQVILPRLKTI